MKRRRRRLYLPILLSLSMIISMVLPMGGFVSAAGEENSDLTNLHGLSGQWSQDETGFHGISGGGDVFAIADDRVEKHDLFTYEAEVTSTSTNPDFNASLVYGLKNPANPTERFYDFGIMTGSDRYIRFDQTNGIPLNGVDVGDLAEDKNTYHVKIVRNTETEFEYFVDGVSVLKKEQQNFEGGYVGMMTNDNGSYQNIRLTINGKCGGFESNLNTWKAQSGTWTESPAGYEAQCAGNNFMLSSTRLGADTLFTYEADVTPKVDNSGLAFGIKDESNPSERWFCFSVVREGNIALIFNQTDGDPGDSLRIIGLNEEEKSQDTFHLKVVRKDISTFEYYIGDRLIHTETVTGFEGGIFGLLCTQSGVFQNAYLTLQGDASSEFATNLTGWTPINGTWGITVGGYKGVTAGGDTWAFAKDQMVTAEDAFIYEADMKLEEGNHAAGLIFGVQDPLDPAGRPSRLYCLMAVKDEGNVLIFTHKDGAAEWIEVAALNDADQAAENYHLRIEYLESKNANFYINGVLCKSISIPKFEGGYFGTIVSGATTAVFNNVYYYPAKTPVLDEIELIGAELDSPFNAGDHAYWAKASYDTEAVKVKAKFDEEKYEATIGGQRASSGQEMEIKLVDGLNAVNVIVTDPESGLSDTYMINIVREPDADSLYKETARPQLHFTPYMYQMNDPNGLLYDDARGEYHLFFQCNRPFDTGVEGLSGTTSWGHAVSKDMVNWEELPLAITPDENGMAWSGSGVIDRNNTSGLFDESTPPGSRIVVFYANVGGDNTYGYAKQSMAYSKDGGRTFIKYSGNPVVKNTGNQYGHGMRDPKVFWYEDETMENGGIWVMVTVGDLHIFTSHNLIDWKHCGRPVDIHGNVFDSECPDLYPLAVDGDPNHIKWVYTGGGIFYIIGHMEKTGEDTVMFIPETEKIKALNGIADQGPGNPAPETYATQTFSNEPLGRTVSISWLRDPSGQWKDKNWNSAQSLPMEHSLRTVNGTVKLFSYPAAEVNNMRDEKILSLKDVEVDENSENVLKDINATLCDIETVITLGTATEVGFKLRVGDAAGGQELLIKYDRNTQKLYVDKMKTGGGSYLGVYEPDMTVLDGNKIKLRMLLDQICFDVYGNDGEAAVAGLIYSEFENNGMEFFANGTATIDSLDIYSMKEMTRTVPEPEVPTVLSGLTLSAGTLDPVFSADVTEYTVRVANSIETVKVMPEYTGDSLVMINGKEVNSGEYSEEILLKEGENTVTVLSGEILYTLTVIREKTEVPPDEKPEKGLKLNGLEISEGTLSPEFNADILQYKVSVENGVSSICIKPFYEAGICVTVNGKEVSDGALSEAVMLSLGSNTIQIRLEKDGEETVYTILVERKKASDVKKPGEDKTNKPASDGKATAEKSSTGSVKTGETDFLYIMLAAFVISSGILAAVILKRKRNV